MNILVTGGTGYIGSHAVVELLQAGHTVHIIDNLENSSLHVLNRIFQITGKHVPFTCCDIRDRAALEALFSANRFDCCMHFAGLKAVVESTLKPLDYYDNNVPMWILIALFFIWGFIMYRLWTFLENKWK